MVSIRAECANVNAGKCQFLVKKKTLSQAREKNILYLRQKGSKCIHANFHAKTESKQPKTIAVKAAHINVAQIRE